MGGSGHNDGVSGDYEREPSQHDTTALVRPYPVSDGTPADGQASGSGFVPGFGPAPAGYAGPNPEAEAWQARYYMQRTRTRVAVLLAVVAGVVAMGMGVVAWQVSQANPLLSAATDLARSGGSLDLDRLLPDDAVPADPTPQEIEPDGSAALPEVPIGELPGVPDEVQALAATLGITDFGQLLDLAVSFDVMSESEADQLRAAVAAGVAARQ